MRMPILILLISFAYSTNGQFIRIDSILFKGNEKTKNQILIRELDFSPGDSVAINTLDARLEYNRRKLMNTNLFIWVKADLNQSPNGHLKISFEFLEQWYILGYPIFQLADRNLNDWWSRGRDLNRSIYGIHFIHNNFQGRNEKLMIKAETGFTQRLDFTYSNPYLDKKKTLGLAVNASYSTSKTIPYKTRNDTLQYLTTEKILRERWTGGITLRKRFKFYDLQTLELKYTHTVISDTIVKLNPTYFALNTKEQNFTQFLYTYSYDFRDLIAYPLRGRKFDITFNKVGLLPADQVDFWEISGAIAYFFDLGSHFFITTQVKGKISKNTNIPYANIRGLGYGNEIVRGYELNVLDGTSYFLNRNTIKFQLLNKVFKLPFLPIKQFNQIPIAIYPTAFYDFAYVNNNFSANENNLVNQWISGGGLGFDVVTYYNLVCKFGFPVTNESKIGMVIGIGREF
jgi:outer membrane protein assembly factor BamA